MWVSEQILFALARLLYRTEVAHSNEMKTALQSEGAFVAYRSAEADRIFEALDRYGVSVSGRDVLDFGCNEGVISAEYLHRGAKSVVGLDVDRDAIARARVRHAHPALHFAESQVDAVPLPDQSIDTVISFDVFEHVSKPPAILKELFRVLRPGGKALIATWSWRHPFAPHLWSVMPVPWSHMFFSERTVLRVCRRVYHSSWYVPNKHDFDGSGNRFSDKYTEEAIPTDYLNKYLIRDFERAFKAAGFVSETHALPFGSSYARWTGAFLRLPGFREFLTGYAWFVLTKPSLDRNQA